MEIGQKLKTLIVEQDPDISRLIQERLELHGFETQAESKLDDILDVLEKGHFEIVLLADDLIGADALDIAGRIRTELSHKPEVILLTDNPRLSVFDVHQSGACHSLQKPLNFDALVESVERFGRSKLRPRGERVDINPQVLGKLYGLALSQNPAHETFHIEVKNIGRGGFFIEILVGHRAPAVGEIIEFELKLGMVPDYSFSGKGVVRWARSTILESGVGVEFLDIPSDSQRLIHAFVDLFKIKSFVPSQF